MFALPAVVAMSWIVALEGWRVRQPRHPLFARPFVYTLEDAIALDDVQAAHRFLRAGQDPNALITVADPQITAGQPVVARPVVWAAAKQSRGSLLMLIAFGARPDAETARQLACVSARLGNREIDAVVRKYVRDAAVAGCAMDGPLLPGS